MSFTLVNQSNSCLPLTKHILIGNSSNNSNKMWWLLLLEGGDLNSSSQYFLLHRGNSTSIIHWIFSVCSLICLPGRRSKFPKRGIDSHASRDGYLASHPFTLPHLFTDLRRVGALFCNIVCLKIHLFIWLQQVFFGAHRIFDLLCETWGF